MFVLILLHKKKNEKFPVLSWFGSAGFISFASLENSSLELKECYWQIREWDIHLIHNEIKHNCPRVMLGILFFALVFYFNLLLISCFSRVRLCATPEMAAHQAPLSLGSSRQEHWSGLAFPSPMNERERESEVTQSCLTLSDPMDCSLSGSSIHGIFQTRVPR